MSDKCPVCKTPLAIRTPLEIKQSVVCGNCGLELEVVWLYPLELAKVSDSKTDPKRRNLVRPVENKPTG